jgi:hypothetical protein
MKAQRYRVDEESYAATPRPACSGRGGSETGQREPEPEPNPTAPLPQGVCPPQ